MYSQLESCFSSHGGETKMTKSNVLNVCLGAIEHLPLSTVASLLTIPFIWEKAHPPLSGLGLDGDGFEGIEVRLKT